MISRVTLFLFALAALPAAATASPAAKLEQDYQQARALALRDERVREAYEDADRRLEEKMIKLNPSLEAYVKYRRNGGSAVGFLAGRRTPARPIARPISRAPQAAPVPAPRRASGRTHVVARGETLVSIAARYRITLAALKAANGNPNERRLIVGQVLAIPRK